MSKKFINPSEDIQTKLKTEIKRRYPELVEQNPSISYDKEQSGCLFTATVTFYSPHRLTAIFKYIRNSSGNREYDWYCSNDWND